MVKWSLDNKYILSGSMEMNIRVWKARAAEKLGVVSFYLYSCRLCPKDSGNGQFFNLKGVHW